MAAAAARPTAMARLVAIGVARGDPVAHAVARGDPEAPMTPTARGGPEDLGARGNPETLRAPKSYFPPLRDELKKRTRSR